jgi:WS/DGAT/MGAT family acyltransferase
VVEGLEGDRFALIAKAHHAMVDGVSGMDVLTVLLSPVAISEFEPGPPWTPRAAPGPVELVLGEVYRRAAGICAAASNVARTLRQPWTAVREASETLAGVVETLGMSSVTASPTPLNDTIGPHRRFDWARFDLEAVKAVKQRIGGTVNDVVLATVSGAARRFLAARGVPVGRLDFRAMVPVSVRTASQHGTLGNRVANFIAPLPVDEPDPLARYRKVVHATSQQKGSRVVHGTEVIEELGNWIRRRRNEMAAQWRPFNVVVTNVPGHRSALSVGRRCWTYRWSSCESGHRLRLFSYAGSCSGVSTPIGTRFRTCTTSRRRWDSGAGTQRVASRRWAPPSRRPPAGGRHVLLPYRRMPNRSSKPSPVRPGAGRPGSGRSAEDHRIAPRGCPRTSIPGMTWAPCPAR